MLYLDAAHAAPDGGPLPTGCGSTTWTDLAPSSAGPSTLNGFGSGLGCGPFSGWQGTGAAGDPYRLTFDGYENYVQTDYTGSGLTAFSVEAWFQSPSSDLSSGVARQVLYENRGPVGLQGQSLTLELGQGVPGFIFDSDGTFTGIQATQAYNDNRWHHLVGTWSSPDGDDVAPSQFALYVDGAAVPTTGTQQLSAQPPLAGNGAAKVGRHDAWDTWYQGSIGEVAAFTRVLSATEVYQRCQAGAGTYGVPVCGSLGDSLADGGEPYAFPGAASGTSLLNVQFGGPGPGLGAAVGEGAVGSSASDVWNKGGSGELNLYTLTGLAWANDTPSPITITGTNLPGAWGAAGGGDAGFIMGYSYSFNGSTASLEFDSVPDGIYDLYLYSSVPNPGGDETDNSGFQVNIDNGEGDVLYGGPTQYTSTVFPTLSYFEAGVQYVVFRGLPARSGTRLVVTISNGVQGTGNDGCQINALQLQQTSPTVATNLWAIHPSALASVGDTITLEGLFGAGSVVYFSGGVTAVATNLANPDSAERLVVTVPAGAVSGPVYVTSQLGISGPINLEIASYTVGLQPFEHDYTQEVYARQATDFPIPTNSGAAVRDDQYALFVGGLNYQLEQVTSVQQAMINGDDTLGTMQPATNQLPLALREPAAVRLGNYLYVISGENSTQAAQADVYRSAIQSDGTPGAWIDTATPLLTPRLGHAAIVLGNRLYIVGGVIGSPAPPVEYAIINPDGTLQPFQLAGFSLNLPRYYLGIVATQSALYAVGGFTSQPAYGASSTIEYAPLGPDGTMAPFVTSSNVLSQPRAFSQSEVVGQHLFLVGGYAGSQVASIDEAIVAADGGLGPFALNAIQLPEGTNLESVLRVGSQLYVMGAGNVGSPSGNTQSVHASTNASGLFGSWGESSSSVLSTARRAFGAAVIGESYYVFGGQQDADQGYAFLNAIESAPIEPTGQLGSWVTNAQTTIDQGSAVTAAVIGNNVYLIGIYGFGPVNATGIVQAGINSDGTIGPFTQYSQSLLESVAGEAVVAYQGSLYVFGGGNPGGGDDPIVEAAPIFVDGGLGVFANVGTMKETGSNIGYAVVGDKVFAFGGDDIGNDQSYVQVMPGSLDGGASFTGTFGLVPGVSVVEPKAAFTTAVVGSKIYLLGGVDQPSGVPTTSMEVATLSAAGALSTFVDAGNIPMNLNESSSLVAHGYLSLVAGD